MADFEAASVDAAGLNQELQLNQNTPSMDWTTTFSSKAEKPDISCSRKLAPPASRETVLRQFENLAGWRRVDRDGELLVAGWSKKREHGSSQDSSVTGPAAADASKQSSTPEYRDFEIKTKRMRLNLAPMAESIANEPPSSKKETSTPPPLSFDEALAALARSKSTVFEEISDDEGYHTASVASPNSVGNPDADDDSLVTSLAAIHEHMPTIHIPASQSSNLSERPVKDNEQLQVEERSARRSEHLREQAKRGVIEQDDEAGLFSGADADSELVTRAEQSTGASFTDIYNSVSTASSFRHPAIPARRASSLTTKDSPRRATPCYQLSQPSFRRGSFTSQQQTEARARPSFLGTSNPTGVFDPVENLKQGLRREKLPVPTSRPLRRVRFGDVSPHPASRAAANRWRTQERHSEYNTETTRAAANPDREVRLRNIQAGLSTKIVSEPDPPEIWPEEFLGSEARLDARDQSVDQTPIAQAQPRQRPAGFDRPSGVERPTREVEYTNDKSQGLLQESDRPDRVYTRPSVIPGLPTQQREADDQFAHLPLGEVADIDVTDDEAVKVERRRLRDLASDLRVIKETYTEMAKIWAVRGFVQSEAVMQNEAEQVANYVLDQRKFGKYRPTLVRIRDSYKRKASSRLEFGETPQLEIDLAYKDLLTESRASRLEEAQAKVTKSMLELEAALQSHKQKLKEEKKASRQDELESSKQARQAGRDAERDTERERRVQQPKQPKLTKSEQQLARLYRLRGEYEAQGQVDQGQIVEARDDNQDSASEISEEDAEGTSYVNGGFSAAPRTGMMAQPAYDGGERVGLIVEENDLEEISALEKERQREAQLPKGGGQAFDEKLLLEMQLTKLKRKEQVGFDDLAEENDDDPIEVEYDDDDDDDDDGTDSDSESDEEEDEYVFRYTVKGVFRGMPDLYRAGDEYTFARFYRREQAEERLVVIMKQIHRKCAAKYEAINLSSTLTPSGITEQKLKADHKNLYVRMWVDEKLISRSKVESRLARKLPLINTTSAWYVDWEKTITTTTITPAGASVDKSATDEDDDDLFGTSTPEPDHVEVETRVERPGIEEIQMLTNSMQANLLAKDNYMSWFAGFAPTYEKPSIRYPDYYGQLKLVHDERQREVERAMDGVGVGPWEEELGRKLPNDGLQENGVKVSVKEKYMVVVRRKRFLGAPN